VPLASNHVSPTAEQQQRRQTNYDSGRAGGTTLAGIPGRTLRRAGRRAELCKSAQDRVSRDAHFVPMGNWPRYRASLKPVSNSP
jgi:hypothetical protein